MAINQYSLASLLLRPKCHLSDGTEEPLGSATGFIVQHLTQSFLITNWHVVSGRRNDNGQPLAAHGAQPTKIEIWHNRISSPKTISWVLTSEALYNENNNPRWLEHPRFGRRVDAVALPLQITTGVNFLPYPVGDGPPEKTLAADVPESVNIIGFPYGEAAMGRIAIWVQGSIATDMSIGYGELPCFLVDSRTRQGQSGSPVIVYRGPGDSARMANGSVIMGHPPMARLLGVYSGRMNPESDLGKVWRTSAIQEIIQTGIPGNADLRQP